MFESWSSSLTVLDGFLSSESPHLFTIVHQSSFMPIWQTLIDAGVIFPSYTPLKTCKKFMMVVVPVLTHWSRHVRFPVWASGADDNIQVSLYLLWLGSDSIPGHLIECKIWAPGCPDDAAVPFFESFVDCSQIKIVVKVHLMYHLMKATEWAWKDLMLKKV